MSWMRDGRLDAALPLPLPLPLHGWETAKSSSHSHRAAVPLHNACAAMTTTCDE